MKSYLTQTLCQTLSSSKLLRVLDKEMLIYLKGITFFLRTNSNSMGSHSYILGSLHRRHRKLALI